MTTHQIFSIGVIAAVVLGIWLLLKWIDKSDPVDDTMDVAKAFGVDQSPEQCTNCGATTAQRHMSYYCIRDRAMGAMHYCCPGQCALAPAASKVEQTLEPVTTLREETIGETLVQAEPVRDPAVARPYAIGGWEDVGGVKVHRACLNARRDGGRLCEYCRPFLVGPAAELPR